MTRLIFVDDDLVLVLEVELPAAELVEAIQNRLWPLPPALAAHQALRAARLGPLVIAAPAGPHAAPGAAPPEAPAGADGRSRRGFSPRQAQVLQGLADGLTTKEIAAQLGLRESTVGMHIAAIKQRFGTSSRAQSVLRGAALGLCKVRSRPK
jgi:DNA-binding NarL/FixJ family response regulator